MDDQSDLFHFLSFGCYDVHTVRESEVIHIITFGLLFPFAGTTSIPQKGNLNSTLFLMFHSKNSTCNIQNLE